MASEIKRILTAKEVVEAYGFHPNHSGFIHCPFHHGDRFPSLKVYDGDRGWHCFGCQKGGSVIDFVMELFEIGFHEACLRLNHDFQLGLSDRKPTPAEISDRLKDRQKKADQKKADDEEYRKMAEKHRYWLEIKKQFEPESGSSYIHPLYAEAIKNLPYLDWWLEEHLGR